MVAGVMENATTAYAAEAQRALEVEAGAAAAAFVSECVSSAVDAAQAAGAAPAEVKKENAILRFFSGLFGRK